MCLAQGPQRSEQLTAKSHETLKWLFTVNCHLPKRKLVKLAIYSQLSIAILTFFCYMYLQINHIEC